MLRKSLRLVMRIVFVGFWAVVTFCMTVFVFLALQMAIGDGVMSLAPLKGALWPLLLYALVVWVHQKARENQSAHEVDWQVFAYFAAVAMLWALSFAVVWRGPLLWGNGSIHGLLHALAMLSVLGFPMFYPAFLYCRYIRKIQPKRS